MQRQMKESGDFNFNRTGPGILMNTFEISHLCLHSFLSFIYEARIYAVPLGRECGPSYL